MSTPTDEQLKPIQHTHGHARVSASPGSGKTFMLIERIVHLIKSGVPPQRIMPVMYNKDSQLDFQERLHKRLSREDGTIQPPQPVTFHAMAKRALEALERQGLVNTRRLETNESGMYGMIRDALQQAGIDPNRGQNIVDDFRAYLEIVKSDIERTPETWLQLAGWTSSDEHKNFATAFAHYEQARAISGIRFFNDLLYDLAIAIRDRTDVADFMSGHYEHILCDEFQDANGVQMYIIKAVAGDKASVMAVGDVDQVLYTFRGARPEFILSKFAECFSPCHDFMLTRTFRYGHTLALAANNVITENEHRDNKICIASEHAPRTDIDVLPASDSQESARITGDALARWIKNGNQPNTAAVLVRVYSSSIAIELELIRRGIPYRLDGAPTVFSDPDMAGVMAALAIASKHHTDWSADQLTKALTGYLDLPPLGVHPKKRTQAASRYANALLNPSMPDQTAPQTILSAAQGEGQFALRQVQKKAGNLAGLQALGPNTPTAQFVTEALKSNGAIEFFERKGKSDNASLRAAKLRVIGQAVEALGSTTHEALCALLNLAQQAHENARDERGVLITSVHRSKGREWPLVILPHLEDGVFPQRREPNVKGVMPALESERCLFYVAATRAASKLLLVPTGDNGNGFV